MLRAFKTSDIDKLKEIHEKFYKEEFSFPDFSDHFLNLFAITDENDNIISAGGVKTITESIIITDKSRSVRERHAALLEILSASIYTCESFGYRQLHAFVQDSNWNKVLNKFDFKGCKGKALYTGW
jgi:hypothetical protein